MISRAVEASTVPAFLAAVVAATTQSPVITLGVFLVGLGIGVVIGRWSRRADSA